MLKRKGSRRAARTEVITRRVGRAVLEDGMLRVGPVMAVPAVLRTFAIDPAAVLVDFDLAESFFEDPENTLSMAMVGRLLGRCVALTGCEHFGLLVGQRAGASSLGTLGFLMQSSETVGVALAAFVEHLKVQDRGGTAWIDSDDGLTTLGYTLFDAGAESLDQIMACAIAIAVNFLRALGGPLWHPHEVLFAFARPEDEEPYQRAFRVRPRFDAERTGIVFPTQQLLAPIPSADLLLHKLMEERVRELTLTPTDGPDAQVRRLLRTLVTSGNCTADAVADRMGVHVRKLNRDLAVAGTTFLKLREEARRELACQLLENTRMTASEIAAMLGYTDPASFTRAFHRWTGSTPTHWRASQRP